jgi:hypothetical protein
MMRVVQELKDWRPITVSFTHRSSCGQNETEVKFSRKRLSGKKKSKAVPLHAIEAHGGEEV